MKTFRILFIAVFSVFFISSCSLFNKKSIDVKLIPVKAGDKYQYIDKEGKIVINPQFEEASMFRDGIALVLTSGKSEKYGFIDESGKYIITPNYIEATIFSEGIAYVVSENGAPTAIDKGGKTLFTLKDAENARIFKEGLSAFCISDTSGKKWGFVDKGGKVAINPQFSSIADFNEGTCAVKNKDDKWGYINKEGKITINPQFDEAYAFVNGKATVVIDEKAGIIDEDGKYFINPQYDFIIVDKNSFLIKQDDKYGWCDDKGKITINPQFDKAYIFNENELTPVQTDDKWGYIDKEGKIIINMQFDEAYPFVGKIATVVSGDKLGFIDKEGKFVINPQFDDISNDFFYFIYGETYYDEVESDFFNVDAVSSFFKKEVTSTTISGISINSKIKEISVKYVKTQNDYDKYSGLTELVTSKNIINGVDFNMFMIGNPWVDDYYDYSLNENYIPTGYYYTLKLTGRAKGKDKLLFKSLESAFKDYKLDKELSSEKTKLLKSKTHGILLCKLDGQISVVIIKNEFLIDVFNSLKEEAEDLEEANSEYNGYDEATEEVAPIEEPAPYEESAPAEEAPPAKAY